MRVRSMRRLGREGKAVDKLAYERVELVSYL